MGVSMCDCRDPTEGHGAVVEWVHVAWPRRHAQLVDGLAQRARYYTGGRAGQ